MKKRKLGPTGSELSKEDEEKILGWFEPNPKYDFLFANEKADIEVFMPFERRIRIRDKMLRSRYVYEGIPQLNRKIGEYKVKKKKLSENKSHHKKFIEEIRDVLSLGKPTEEEMIYLQNRKERWKKRQLKWEKSFQDFETWDKKWIGVQNEKLKQPDIEVSKNLIIAEYKEEVKKKLCQQRYGEWTTLKVLTFIIREIGIRKKLLGKPLINSGTAKHKTQISEQKPIEYPFIKIICQNKDEIVRQLWEGLTVSFVPDTSWEIFQTHFTPEVESDDLIKWDGNPLPLLYLLNELQDYQIIQFFKQDIKTIRLALAHFDIPLQKKDQTSKENRSEETLKPIMSGLNKVLGNPDPNKKKSKDLQAIDAIILLLKQLSESP